MHFNINHTARWRGAADIRLSHLLAQDTEAQCRSVRRVVIARPLDFTWPADRAARRATLLRLCVNVKDAIMLYSTARELARDTALDTAFTQLVTYGTYIEARQALKGVHTLFDPLFRLSP